MCLPRACTPSAAVYVDQDRLASLSIILVASIQIHRTVHGLGVGIGLDPDCGKILNFNYSSGEAITHVDPGSPMIVRSQKASFNLPNLMRALLSSALATLKLGNNILLKKEKVKVDTLYGHGGYFKTKGVGQQLLADALDVPVSVMSTAGEGGPWGMALLSSYCVNRDEGESLPDFLQNKVFHGETGESLSPDPEGVKGFEAYADAYEKGLQLEKEAYKCWSD